MHGYIKRTSPKGDNFKGTCQACGKSNLTDVYDGECIPLTDKERDGFLIQSLEYNEFIDKE